MARQLETYEHAALASYAAEHGRNWKRELELDWYNARVIGERGSILHGLRNDPSFGWRGLIEYKLPKKSAHVQALHDEADYRDTVRASHDF